MVTGGAGRVGLAYRAGHWDSGVNLFSFPPITNYKSNCLKKVLLNGIVVQHSVVQCHAVRCNVHPNLQHWAQQLLVRILF